ncbi:hypothetical protein [Dokdonia sp.]|uniref:hypothetical protein n=1 Tax=Dokdonia sp. TaxID=2024995 RepID=UPI00326745F6
MIFDKKFFKGLIKYFGIVLLIHIVLIFIAGGMVMDGAGNYQEEASILIGIVRYVFGFPTFWIIDFDLYFNQTEFPVLLLVLFIVNVILQWVIIKYIQERIKKKKA